MTRYYRSTVALGVVLVPLFLTGEARASDWYVDAVAGDDAHAGTSPANSWRTITHALAALSSGSGQETVHVAAGTYSVLSGEVFPLVVRDQLQIVGDAGADATFVVAHAVGTTGFSIAADHEHNTGGVGSATALSGLTIQGCGVGVEVIARAHACNPTLHDLSLRACGMGVRVAIQPYIGSSGPTASPELLRVQFTSNGTGLLVTSAASFADPSAGRVTVGESLFVGNYDGVVLEGFGRSPELDIDRSRFLGQALYGVRASGRIPPLETGATVVLRDSLFARNGEGGALLDDVFVETGSVVGCTFADSPGFGLRVFAADTRVANTIAWGNHPDAELLNDADVSHCDIGMPSYALVQGSIDADPMFLDVAHDDYRLRFGSPCVDHADDTASSLIDLSGRTRRVDGDLDTVAAADMGAFELLPLDVVGVPAIGHTIGIAFLGAEGAASTLFVAHAPLVPPSATPFGISWLPGMGTVQAAVVHVHAGPPYVLRRRIPYDPALVGTTFSFQALTHSASVPAGQAWTNPVTFVIGP